MDSKATALILVFFSLTFPVFAQSDAVDTTSYLTYDYENALEFNLMVAASQGHDSEVERLIGKGADIEFYFEYGVTPLIYAVANDNLSTVNLLIDHNADVNITTSKYESPLVIAIQNGNLEIAESLIRADANIDFKNNYGVAPLHYTAYYGMNDLTDLLIYYGADIDIQTNDGTTPLMVAIMEKNNGVAELLMRYGANLEATDAEGFTPFMSAAQAGNLEMVKYLHEQNVSIYKSNLYKWNALALAIRTKNEETVKELLSYGDEWNSPNSRTVNLYKEAAKAGNQNISDMLKQSSMPDNYKRSFDQMTIAYSWLFNAHGLYNGINIQISEPVSHIGFDIGFDTKLGKSKVISQQSDDLYYQFKEKSSIIYGGLTKDFYLTKRIYHSNWAITSALNVGYYFKQKDDTEISERSTDFKVMPSIGLKVDLKNTHLYANVEYMSTEYLHTGPLWFRFGVSHSLFFDNYDNAPLKTIKWKWNQ